MKTYLIRLIVGCFIFCVHACTTTKAQERPPNIVFIMADDLGYECITANGGNSYNTPHIDRLATQGMRFTHCYAQPKCTPSRVQLMTGQYNVRNYTRFRELDRSQTTFAHQLQKAGYRTAIAGKWQLGKEKDSPQHFGFEQSCLWQQSLPRTDKEGHDTRYVNPVLEYNGVVTHLKDGAYAPDVVSDFLCDFIDKNKEMPFLVYYSMILTHCPFTPTPESEAWDPNSKGSKDYTGETRYFADMVSYMDKMVGKIISKIDALGLTDNTLIVFTGDNGTDRPITSIFLDKKYPGGKSKTTDNGTHVPLVARWPNHIESHATYEGLVDFSDFFPTFCELAGVRIPNNLPMDGISFLPQLLGHKTPSRNWIYSWYEHRGKVTELARNKTYKLYDNGAFYNVKEDFHEEKALSSDRLNAAQRQQYNDLKQALTLFKDTRKQNP